MKSELNKQLGNDLIANGFISYGKGIFKKTTNKPYGGHMLTTQFEAHVFKSKDGAVLYIDGTLRINHFTTIAQIESYLS